MKVMHDFRHAIKEVGILKQRRTLGFLKRNIGLLWRFACVTKCPIKMPNDFRNGALCFVLGNGPSLNQDIAEKLDIFRMGDTFCVNEFAKADLYYKLQPRYYVIADPLYWSPTASDSFISVRNHLFDEILSKTSWPLTIFVPLAAKELFARIFSNSQNISVSYYNSTPLQGDNRISNRLYDLDLGMPVSQNVLIPTLFLSLRLGYKKIILLGADHSWHETFVLDDMNRVCFRPRHFYKGDTKLIPFVPEGTNEGEAWTMDKWFYALAKMFEGYWKLEAYAKHVGAQVYNASSVTYIDAFRRISVQEIKERL